MKVEAVISSAISPSARSKPDCWKKLNQTWTRRLLTSCIAAVVSSIFGLAIAAGSMLGLITSGGTVSVFGSMLLVAAFLMLIRVAHCCDRLGEFRHEQRIAAFRKRSFND
jgi:hypothetical protein